MIFNSPTKKTKSSESIAQIAKALSQVQAEIQNPANSAVNPFFKSKYAPLPDVLKIIRPLAGKYGLAIIQNSYNEEDKVFINTLIIHESGEWIETDPLVLKPEKNTPQGVGSAITYGRRYAISAVFGISSEEDDDGNSNEKEKPKAKKDEPAVETVNPELAAAKKKAMDICKEKAAMNEENKAKVKAVVVTYHASGNPNKIEDVEQLNKLIIELNKI
jgi:hypothetical protein